MITNRNVVSNEPKRYQKVFVRSYQAWHYWLKLSLSSRFLKWKRYFQQQLRSFRYNDGNINQYCKMRRRFFRVFKHNYKRINLWIFCSLTVCFIDEILYCLEIFMGRFICCLPNFTITVLQWVEFKLFPFRINLCVKEATCNMFDGEQSLYNLHKNQRK